MKRIFTMKHTFVITVLLLVIATTAQAGILSSAKDWVFDNAIGTILSCIFIVIAGFFGGTVWGKALLRAKVPIQKLSDVIAKVRKARRADSPGGESMTPEERDDILKEVEELLRSFIDIFGKGK